MSNPTPRLPTLKEDNYPHWKKKVEAYCMEKNLDGYLLSDKASTANEDQEELWMERKIQTAGILLGNLSDDNESRFVTDDNRRNPHLLWSALQKHFEANTTQNQAKIYRKFLHVNFRTTLSDFLVQIDNSIANMRSVGLKIGIPEPDQPDVNEVLLSEQIIDKLPSSFDTTKDLIALKRPLTLQKVRDQLNEKSLDSGNNPVIKTESALKATTSNNYCDNGKHNPKTRHSEARCYQLHPELAPKLYKNKRSAKTATTTSSDIGDNHSISSQHGVYYCAGKAFFTSCDDRDGLILLDSGCSDHMIPTRSSFFNYTQMNSSVEIADGQKLKIVGSGHIKLKNLSGQIHVFKALHVPDLSHPLISFGRLFLKNCDFVRQGPTSFAIVDVSSSVKLFTGVVEGKILALAAHILKASGQSPQLLMHVSNKATIAEAEILHRRAGHPSAEALKLMYDVDFSTLKCDSCRVSKSQRLPFVGSLPTPAGLLDYIYMDLSGKITPSTLGGGKYYFKITDAFSSFKYIYILSTKSKALEKFKIFCNEVQNFHSIKIKNVVTDGGGEFCSKAFDEFYQSTGIIHHVTAPYTPQQNSIAERGNRTTSEKARALLKQASLPSSLWGEAVVTAVLYENITPMKRLRWETPHKIWYGLKFNTDRLKTFGCRAYVNIPKEIRNGKFGDTAKRGILVGYRQGIHNWRILFPGNRVEYSHDVVFDESCFPGISPVPDADQCQSSLFEEEDDSHLDPPRLPSTIASDPPEHSHEGNPTITK
jgi:transposase InsO family protein